MTFAWLTISISQFEPFLADQNQAGVCASYVFNVFLNQEGPTWLARLPPFGFPMVKIMDLSDGLTASPWLLLGLSSERGSSSELLGPRATPASKVPAFRIVQVLHVPGQARVMRLGLGGDIGEGFQCEFGNAGGGGGLRARFGGVKGWSVGPPLQP